MTQDGLINNILDTCGMGDCNPNTIPTDVQDPLVTYSKVNPTQYQDWWKYASVIVIMVYVTNNSRTGIAFDVRHCARFTHKPKHSHQKAVMSICRYFQGDCNDGEIDVLVIRPSSNMAVD